MFGARGCCVVGFAVGLLALQAPARADLMQDCTQYAHVELKITACSALIDRRTRVAWAYTNRASAYLDKGELGRAFDDASKALAMDPQQHDATAVRGMVHYHQGAHQEAIAEFTKLISVTGQAMAYVFRSMPYQESGNFEKALADLATALQIDGRSAAAYLRRGEVHRAMAATDRALADYARAIELDPADPEPLTGRCLVYERLGDYGRAIADCRAALQKETRSYTERRALVVAREAMSRLEGSGRYGVDRPVWRDLPGQSNF